MERGQEEEENASKRKVRSNFGSINEGISMNEYSAKLKCLHISFFLLSPCKCSWRGGELSLSQLKWSQRVRFQYTNRHHL